MNFSLSQYLAFNYQQFRVEIHNNSLQGRAGNMCDFQKSLLWIKYWFANFHDDVANHF